MRAIVANPSILANVNTHFAACPACGVVQRFVYGRVNQCSVCHAPFEFDGEELRVVTGQSDAVSAPEAVANEVPS